MNKFFLILVTFLFGGCAMAKTSSETKVEYPKEAIVQSILDLKELELYFHPEVPGRVPLVISDRGISPDFKLKKFGRDVQIVADKKVKGAYLRFTVFECNNGDYCNIAFEYPIEGVTGGTGVSINPDGSFQLEKTEIGER